MAQQVLKIKNEEDLKNLFEDLYNGKLHIAESSEEIVVKSSLPHYSENNCADLYVCCQELQNRHKEAKITLDIDSDDAQGLKVGDILEMVNIEDEFYKQKIDIVFDDEFSLNEALNATNRLDKVVKKIKKLNLSPFESYLYAYIIVANNIYNKGDDKNWKTSRTLIGVLNSDKIVCAGYANLLAYICKELGIEAVTQIFAPREKGGRGHKNNIIHLVDPKYGIDGYYYADACWDSRITGGVPALNFSLVPFDDVTKCDVGDGGTGKFNFNFLQKMLYNNSKTGYFFSLDYYHFNDMLSDLNNLGVFKGVQKDLNLKQKAELAKYNFEISKSNGRFNLEFFEREISLDDKTKEDIDFWLNEACEKIDMMRENSKPVPLESYEKALKKLYEMSPTPKNLNFLNRILNGSIDSADECFKKNDELAWLGLIEEPINCFSKENERLRNNQNEK